MNKLNKIHGLFALFVLLILILLIKPSVIKNIYGSFLGRIVLICIVLFFAMNNMTLGLLTALVFIIFSNMVFREGVENMDGTSTGTAIETTIPTDDGQTPVSSLTTKEEEDKEQVVGTGTSITDDELVKAVQSSTIPVETSSSSEDVVPAGDIKQGFQTMYASF